MTKKELIKIANELDKKGNYRVAEYYDNVLRLAQQNLGSVENAYAYGTEALSTTNAVSLSKYNTINATLGLPFSFPNSATELNLMPEPSPPSQFQMSMAEIDGVDISILITDHIGGLGTCDSNVNDSRRERKE